MKQIICLSVLLSVLALPALAQDAAPSEDTPAEQQTAAPAVEDKSFIYAPEGCDFQITFPEEPYNTRRCPEGGAQCYNLTTYTMVFDLRTTVDVSVSCNPSTPDNYARYSEGVMRTALEGMVTRKNIAEYDIGFKEYETVRQATLTGSGQQGRQNKIYTAQIWAGQNSIFTVQAELIGNAHPEADATFSDILKSLKMKEPPKPAAAEENDED